jgi:hypothetical protein
MIWTPDRRILVPSRGTRRPRRMFPPLLAMADGDLQLNGGGAILLDCLGRRRLKCCTYIQATSCADGSTLDKWVDQSTITLPYYFGDGGTCYKWDTGNPTTTDPTGKTIVTPSGRTDSCAGSYPNSGSAIVTISGATMCAGVSGSVNSTWTIPWISSGQWYGRIGVVVSVASACLSSGSPSITDNAVVAYFPSGPSGNIAVVIEIIYTAGGSEAVGQDSGWYKDYDPCASTQSGLGPIPFSPGCGSGSCPLLLSTGGVATVTFV